MQIQRILQTVDNQCLVIQVPESFINKQVEVLVITTLDNTESKKPQQRRIPPPNLAGRIQDKGEVLSSVPTEDWGIN